MTAERDNYVFMNKKVLINTQSLVVNNTEAGIVNKHYKKVWYLHDFESLKPILTGATHKASQDNTRLTTSFQKAPLVKRTSCTDNNGTVKTVRTTSGALGVFS